MFKLIQGGGKSPKSQDLTDPPTAVSVDALEAFAEKVIEIESKASKKRDILDEGTGLTVSSLRSLKTSRP